MIFSSLGLGTGPHSFDLSSSTVLNSLLLAIRDLSMAIGELPLAIRNWPLTIKCYTLSLTQFKDYLKHYLFCIACDTN